MRYSNSREIDDEVHRLISNGWKLKRGSKHGKLWRPDGKSFVAVPGTPSDWRSMQNFRRDVRRAMRELV